MPLGADKDDASQYMPGVQTDAAELPAMQYVPTSHRLCVADVERTGQ